MGKATTIILSLLTLYAISMFCSCTGQNTDSGAEIKIQRDPTTPVALVPIDSLLPMLHSNTRIWIVGDTLILHDTQSTSCLYYAYDLCADSLMGHFGVFGNGPGEIIRPGNAYFDRDNKVMYANETARLEVVGFNLDDAIADSTYLAFSVVKEDTTLHQVAIPHDMHYVNDSCIVCARYIPSADWSSLSYTLGRFSLIDGITHHLGDLPPEPNTRGHIGLSVADNLIVEASSTKDRIRFYDLSGKLLATITGPDYEEHYNGRNLYYGKAVIGDGLVFAEYSGLNILQHRYGNRIVVLDTHGKYITTLEFEDHLTGFDYHPASGRLYVCTDGSPQFGYFEVKKYIDHDD